MEKDIEDIIQKAVPKEELGKLIQELKMNQRQAEALLTMVVKLATTVTSEVLKKLGLIKDKPKPKKELVCFRCQQKGHLARACTNPAVCKHCSQNHLTRDCPQSLCEKCHKKHPKGHCKKTDVYCKICSVWGLHKAENCPNKGLVSRLKRLEKILPRSRPKSTRFPRREKKGQFPKRGRGRGRGRQANPGPVRVAEPMDQS